MSLVIGKNNPTSRKFPIRRCLEIIGAVLLLIGIYSQRDLLSRSLSTIRHAELAPLLLCLTVTWLLFVWSAFGYKLLLVKKVKLWHIMLAHAAAGGPGRVIPGGAGYLSFGTLFLKKQGLRLPTALSVALTNNIAGFAVNTVVLWTVFAIKPELLQALNLSKKGLAILLLVSMGILIAFLLGRRNRTIKKGTDGTGIELRKIWARLVKHPFRAMLLVLVMLATIGTNTLMLYLAAQAVGLEFPLGSAMVSMSIGVAIGSLIPTPGGVGGVEAGIIAAMYAIGFDLQLSTSAALIYRFATYVEPFIPGVFAYLWLRNKKLL